MYPFIAASCNIPWRTNPLSPYDCYNDAGKQWKYNVEDGFGGFSWTDGDAALLPCSGKLLQDFVKC